MDKDLYDGVPVLALPILEVDVPDPIHLRRSLRYPNAIDIDPAAAIEATLEPRGLIARDRKSRTGEAISSAARRRFGRHPVFMIA